MGHWLWLCGGGGPTPAASHPLKPQKWEQAACCHPWPWRPLWEVCQQCPGAPGYILSPHLDLGHVIRPGPCSNSSQLPQRVAGSSLPSFCCSGLEGSFRALLPGVIRDSL